VREGVAKEQDHDGSPADGTDGARKETLNPCSPVEGRKRETDRDDQTRYPALPCADSLRVEPCR
jgi:hypothetical protein